MKKLLGLLLMSGLSLSAQTQIKKLGLQECIASVTLNTSTSYCGYYLTSSEINQYQKTYYEMKTIHTK